MSKSRDPAVHRQWEEELIQHVEKLLGDQRLFVDTILGRRAVAKLVKDVRCSDKWEQFKPLFADKPRRRQEERPPLGISMEVLLSRRALGIVKSPVGRLLVVCISPMAALAGQAEPQALGLEDVSKLLNDIPAAPKDVPTTLVLLSTSGFTIDAHELVERGVKRTLILIEPHVSGGWNVIGPPQVKGLVDLFDPEGEPEKRRRIRQAIEQQRQQLLSGGLAADELAACTHLPLGLVESELRVHAREILGLATRRVGGKLVLHVEGK